jgi:hypothetical protein
MQRSLPLPVIAIAGLFWLVAQNPATERNYNPPVPIVPVFPDSEVAFGERVEQSVFQVGAYSRYLDGDSFPAYAMAPALIFSAFNPFKGVNGSTWVSGAGLLRTLNDDDADLYKRLNRRPDVRRKERKVRSPWLEWLLGWCLDFIAILAAAEISATIVARAL